jgi:hypothetical protein
VIGRGNNQRVDLVHVLVQHETPVGVGGGVGRHFLDLAPTTFIHVAISDTVSDFGKTNMSFGPSSGADKSETQFLSRGGCGVLRARPDSARRPNPAACHGCSLQKATTRYDAA